MGKKGKEIRGEKEERDQFKCYYRVCYRIAANFCSQKFLRITNKHAGKKFPDFSFHDKVTMSDHTLYNFLREMVTLSVYFNIKMIVRHYYKRGNVLLSFRC